MTDSNITTHNQNAETISAAGQRGLRIHDSFRVTWRERLLVLGSFGGLILAYFVLGLIYDRERTLELMGLIPASGVALGKFLPLWGISGQSNFTPWELGLVIWAMDTWTVIVIVYGLELLYRIRALDRLFATVQTNAGLVLTAYPSMRRAAVTGVTLFVLFPVAGTGALVGSFLGILLGLGRKTLLISVSLGGLLGGMLMAFAAVYFGEGLEHLREVLQDDPVIKFASIAAVVILLGGAFLWLNRTYKRAIEAARKESEQAHERAPHEHAA